jgi:hypothetical protein
MKELIIPLLVRHLTCVNRIFTFQLSEDRKSHFFALREGVRTLLLGGDFEVITIIIHGQILPSSENQTPL